MAEQDSKLHQFLIRTAYAGMAVVGTNKPETINRVTREYPGVPWLALPAGTINGQQELAEPHFPEDPYRTVVGALVFKRNEIARYLFRPAGETVIGQVSDVVYIRNRQAQKKESRDGELPPSRLGQLVQEAISWFVPRQQPIAEGEDDPLRHEWLVGFLLFLEEEDQLYSAAIVLRIVAEIDEPFAEEQVEQGINLAINTRFDVAGQSQHKNGHYHVSNHDQDERLVIPHALFYQLIVEKSLPPAAWDELFAALGEQEAICLEALPETEADWETAYRCLVTLNLATLLEPETT